MDDTAPQAPPAAPSPPSAPSAAQVRIADAYFHAIGRLGQAPWRKLFDPGPRRFIERRMARRARAPVARQVPLFFGSTMTVMLPEVISEQLHGYGLFDDVVSWMALCAVEPGDTVFDVGAHFGYFSLLFAALAGPRGRVVSFEPTPSTHAVLARNVGAVPGAAVVNAAAGASAGTMAIRDYGLRFSAWNSLAPDGRLGTAGGGPGMPPPAEVQVEVLTLDGLAAQRGLAPGFIKIDAENFETEVLDGAAHVLRTGHPTLLLEAGSPRAAALARRLGDEGYRAFATAVPGRLDEFADMADAALRHKDVLYARGDRASRLLACARALGRSGHRAT